MGQLDSISGSAVAGTFELSKLSKDAGFLWEASYFALYLRNLKKDIELNSM
jgi:hypothetical protein